MKKYLNWSATLWVFRVFGTLAVAKGKYKENFSKAMVVLNTIVGVTVCFTPIFLVKYLNKYLEEFWIYVAMAWNFCKN